MNPSTPSLPVRFLATGLLFVALGACSDPSVTAPDPAIGADSGSSPSGTTGSGSTGGAASLPPARSAAHCDGRLGPVQVDDVTVPGGARCLLDGTRVEGNVIVGSDARFEAVGAFIEGNVQAEDARAVTTGAGTFIGGDLQVKRRAATIVDATTIDGNLQIEEGDATLQATASRIRGDLQFKNAAEAVVDGNEIGGNAQLEENRGALAIRSNRVSGDLQVFENRGGVEVRANRVSQSLQCEQNRPAPTGGGNVAGEKEGQCAGL